MAITTSHSKKELDLAAKRTAIQLLIAEDIVEAVTAHQWKTTNEGLSEDISVEISGFGRFKARKKQIEKQIERMKRSLYYNKKSLDEAETPRQEAGALMKIDQTNDQLNYLQSKLDKLQ